jgi:hypothetical protein
MFDVEGCGLHDGGIGKTRKMKLTTWFGVCVLAAILQ